MKGFVAIGASAVDTLGININTPPKYIGKHITLLFLHHAIKMLSFLLFYFLPYFGMLTTCTILSYFFYIL